MRSIQEGKLIEQRSLSRAFLITSMNLSGSLFAQGGNATSDIDAPSTVPVPRLKPCVFFKKDGSEYHSGVSSFTSVGDVFEQISHVCMTERKRRSGKSN